MENVDMKCRWSCVSAGIREALQRSSQLRGWLLWGLALVTSRTMTFLAFDLRLDSWHV